MVQIVECGSVGGLTYGRGQRALDKPQIKSIEEALRLCRSSFVAVAVFSFFINILMLTPMFYMINVFDKAVGTGSISTLAALALLAVFLYVILALLEWVRSRVLIHVAARLDLVLAPRIYELCFQSASGAIHAQDFGSQPLFHLNTLRQFITSSNCAVIFDLPWIPLFLLLMFFFHPALAVVSLICMAIMASVAVLNQRATTSGLKEANAKAASISGATQRNLRNAEVAASMGMVSTLMSRWRANQDEMLNVQSLTSAKASGYSALIKTLTTAMQSAAITTGAVLAIYQEISPGVMIGAALLLGKSIQPIQQGVSSWKAFVEARENYLRLNDLLSAFPIADEKMSLPPIAGRITAKQAFVTPPGGKVPTLSDVNLDLSAGSVTMILGASAAGKSTLVRAILGLWPTAQGEIRIDGAEVHQFDRDELGPQIGYLPQDIELFDGTVAENIARFGDVDSDEVVRAAENAGVHEMVLSFPNGYDTLIRGTSGLLSPGQRQRIALARALYGRPKLLVLDEPNSNLDEVGEQALASAIARAKSAGVTVVIVSHRQGALPLVDHLIIMESGRIREQGPRDAVISQLRATLQEQAKAKAKVSDSHVKAVSGGEQ